MTRARAIRSFAVTAGVLFVAYVIYGIYAAGLDERPPPPSSTDLTFREGHVAGHRITTPSWSADFDRIISNADQSVLDLSNVRNGTIYRGGKPYLHVRAEHMTVNTLSHDFTARGPVHVESVGGKTSRSFDTNSAVWNDSIQQLVLSKHIAIHDGSNGTLSVGSLQFDVRTGQIEVHDIDGPLLFK
jgi:hypothetical protein